MSGGSEAPLGAGIVLVLLVAVIAGAMLWQQHAASVCFAKGGSVAWLHGHRFDYACLSPDGRILG